jgi:Uma2 family endonuclease
MATEIAKKLFTVYDYHKMVDAGILREGDRVELIRGEIIRMSPINPPHNGTIHRANHFLSRIVGDRALSACKAPSGSTNTMSLSLTFTCCDRKTTSIRPGTLDPRTSY